MQIKGGVNIQGLDIKIRPAMIAADNVWKRYNQELVITSGLEGTHSAGSLHYYGLALDLRSRDFEEGTKRYVAESLQAELGSDFDVILHRSHIHVEYDPR